MTLLIVFLIAILIILRFFADTTILYYITKIKKFIIKEPKYLIAFKITLVAYLMEGFYYFVLLGIYFSKNLSEYIKNVTEISFGILFLVIFYLLLKKYYSIKFTKSLIIYITVGIFSFVFSILLMLPVKYFIFQPFYMQGTTMEPNLADKEYLITKVYDKNYKRGDIVVFKNLDSQNDYFIKRIIGLSKEKVQIKDGKIYIYNNDNKQGFALNENYLSKKIITSNLADEVINVEKDHYLVIGDSRTQNDEQYKFYLINKNLIISKYWFSPFNIR